MVAPNSVGTDHIVKVVLSHRMVINKGSLIDKNKVCVQQLKLKKGPT